MRTSHWIAVALVLCTFVSAMASPPSWQPLKNQPNFGAGAILLLRDGRVMVHHDSTNLWSILTPDSTGSYVNGTWSDVAPMDAGYDPNAFSTAVLPNGRLIIEGGEYINYVYNPSSKGEIYDPLANQWTDVQPPSGWAEIADGNSVLLPTGTYMQGSCCNNQVALLGPFNTWTFTGHTHVGDNGEAGWTLLSNDKVLQIDVEASDCDSSLRTTELYDYTRGTWSCGPDVPIQLWKIYYGGAPEIGPAVMTYNGTVVAFGGNSNTAIYNVDQNTWSVGPPFPNRCGTPPNNGCVMADAPAALEPNGLVLAMVSQPFGSPCAFVEFDPGNNTFTPSTPSPPHCPDWESTVPGHLLVLPTGQIMFSDYTYDIEIYSPNPGVVGAAAAHIRKNPGTLVRGSTYNFIFGTQFNGLSQGGMFGDDFQDATNYPLVQLKNTQTGAIFYARTHDDCNSSIAPQSFGCTFFDLPSPTVMPAGTYSFTVIVNGIPSNSFNVTVN